MSAAIKLDDEVDSHAVMSRRTLDVLERFNDVFLNHDPKALDTLVGEDCRLENTQPAPDGSVHIGKDACIALWGGIATSPDLRFEPEWIEADGSRGIIFWRLFFGGGEAQSVRGVNIMRLANGLIVDAKAYVKA